MLHLKFILFSLVATSLFKGWEMVHLKIGDDVLDFHNMTALFFPRLSSIIPSLFHFLCILTDHFWYSWRSHTGKGPPSFPRALGRRRDGAQLHSSALRNTRDKEFTPIKNYKHLLLLYTSKKVVMMVIIQVYFQDFGKDATRNLKKYDNTIKTLKL